MNQVWFGEDDQPEESATIDSAVLLLRFGLREARQSLCVVHWLGKVSLAMLGLQIVMGRNQHDVTNAFQV
jgi:hypothetical protein